MDRRTFVKLVPGASVAAISSGGALAQTSNTPLDDSSRKEFERLLAPQANYSAKFLELRTFREEPQTTLDRVYFWNFAALDISGKDHTPVIDPPDSALPSAKPDHRRFGEQLGPHRASYAMAITQIAMFEAINTFDKKYKSYTGYSSAAAVPTKASRDAAIAQATHDALNYLYPFKSNDIDSVFNSDLARMQGEGSTPQERAASIRDGRKIGQDAAQSIINRRRDDGANHQEIKYSDLPPETGPRKWSPDPVSKIQTALGAKWATVKPFLLTKSDQFRLNEPPGLNDPKYVKAFNEVKDIGRKGEFPKDTSRRDGETFKAVFWGYDGTPNLCAPPRLYNQVVRKIAQDVKRISDASELARLLALCNTAMADAAIAAWDSKYHWRFWRPVTGIRWTGPGGNPGNSADLSWEPLGSPDTNATEGNFTPPFPAYPSGHATFGGALFQVLRRVFETDGKYFPFVLVSDEFNGENRGVNDKLPRPLLPLSYISLADAEFENAFSRIWLGVHWRFDGDDGIALGNHVGDWAFEHGFGKA